MPYDEATGLVFARARYYHPKLGRWMSRDPKGYVDGGNLYEAFGNNQPRYTDPMGSSTATALSVGAFHIKDALEYLGVIPNKLEQFMRGLRHSRQRVIRVMLGAVDTASGTFILCMHPDEIALLNRWARDGYTPELRESLSFCSADQYVAFAEGASFVTSFIPVVPIDYAFDRSLLDVRFNTASDGWETDPISQWLYANPGKHLLIRVVPDIVPLAGEAASQAGKMAYRRLSSIDWQPARRMWGATAQKLDPHIRLTFDQNAVGMNGGNIRLRRANAAERRTWTGEGFRVGPHGEMPSPRPAGQQSHHGVLDKWMRENYAGYSPDAAPTVLMHNAPQHNATRGVYNRWRAEIAKRQGVSVRKINWRGVSRGEIWRLAEEQFDAASIPLSVRNEFWRQFNQYLGTLE